MSRRYHLQLQVHTTQSNHKNIEFTELHSTHPHTTTPWQRSVHFSRATNLTTHMWCQSLAHASSPQCYPHACCAASSSTWLQQDEAATTFDFFSLLYQPNFLEISQTLATILHKRNKKISRWRKFSRIVTAWVDSHFDNEVVHYIR